MSFMNGGFRKIGDVVDGWVEKEGVVKDNSSWNPALDTVVGDAWPLLLQICY